MPQIRHDVLTDRNLIHVYRLMGYQNKFDMADRDNILSHAGGVGFLAIPSQGEATWEHNLIFEHHVFRVIMDCKGTL